MSTDGKASAPDSLVPAVVQDAITGRVLMMAWMSPEAERLTLETREVHFWSRSRQRLWKKGETSGNVLALVSIARDCDGDTLLVRAVPAGPACHTGSTSCFGAHETEAPPTELDALERTIAERRALPPGARSHVRRLLDQGMHAVVSKLAEEGAELGQELLAGPRERVISEAADALFHLMVALAARDVSLADVERELHRRSGVSGLDEKATRTK